MYRFCRYRRDQYGKIESKIFELDDKSMLEGYLKTEEKGWYKHHMLVPELSVIEESEEISQKDAAVLALLNGEGLNHASFTRLLVGKKIITQSDKIKSKKEYDAVLERFKGRITKQNRDWFLNDRT